MKSNKWIIIGALVALFLVVSGITYAYFFAKITGNEKTSTINLEAGTLEIVLDGGNSIVANSIIPSSTPFATKNFTVIGNNDSNGNYMPYSVKLIVDDNTYSDDAISYTLEGTNTSNSGEIIENKPNTKVNYSDIIGSGYFTNGSNLIHTYTIKFYFLDNNTDQSADMRANFAAHIEITGGRASKNKITVNFDPDGGELATLSKEVVINGAYGELPTPTKEGYEFLGWNGKNMLNLEDRIVKDAGLFDNTTIRDFTGNGIYVGLAANNYYNNSNSTLDAYLPKQGIIKSTTKSGSNGYGIGLDILILPNTNYILSYEKLENGYFKYGFFKKDGTYVRYADIGLNIYSQNDEEILTIILASASTGNQALFYKIQLEEGTEATEYEPYYIDKYTKVVQTKDHTLKAIWKEI